MIASPPLGHGLTVVTNSLDAAIATARIPMLSVYNIGGSVSATTSAQEGDWALQELERLHVDVSLICPAGISLAARTRATHASGSGHLARRSRLRTDGDRAGRRIQRGTFRVRPVRRRIAQSRSSARLGPTGGGGLRPILERGLDVVVVDEATEAGSVVAQRTPDESPDGSVRTLTPRRT